MAELQRLTASNTEKACELVYAGTAAALAAIAGIDTPGVTMFRERVQERTATTYAAP